MDATTLPRALDDRPAASRLLAEVRRVDDLRRRLVALVERVEAADRRYGPPGAVG